MMRVASPGGEGNAEEEQECAELMRRIRIMEGKRTSSHVDEQRVISAQRSTIDKLRKSNKAMQEEIYQESKVLAVATMYNLRQCLRPCIQLLCLFSSTHNQICHGFQVANNVASAATQMQQHERLEKLYGLLDAYQRKVIQKLL